MIRHSSFITHHSALILTCGALVAGTAPAAAQQYPVRPIRMILPQGPGSTTDLLGSHRLHPHRRAARKAAGRRQPAGRRRHPGHGNRLSRRARRLHPGRRRRLHADDRAAHLPQDRLRSAARFRAGGLFRAGTDRDLRERQFSGEVGAGFRRAGEGKARAAQHGLRRRRLDEPPGRHPVRDSSRHRGQPRAVQGRGEHGGRGAGRSGVRGGAVERGHAASAGRPRALPGAPAATSARRSRRTCRPSPRAACRVSASTAGTA